MASRRAKPGRNGNLRRGVGKRLRRLPPLDESQPRQQSATAVAAGAWGAGGEDRPGGSTPTPDQSNVDEIGRAYGLQDEDNGSLRTSSEVLAGRDRRRSELQPPRRPQP